MTARKDGRCSQYAEPDASLIDRNIVGATALTDTFVRAYRCASHEAADGRQAFEVPSFLALVTAAIGPSFGLSTDGRLAAAAGSGIYGRANSYFAPKEKAALLDAALDAVICIKTESVGVDFYDTTRTPTGKAGGAILNTQRSVEELSARLGELQDRKAALSGRLEALDREMSRSNAGSTGPGIQALAEARDMAALDLTKLDSSIVRTQAEAARLAVQLAILQNDIANRNADLIIARSLGGGSTLEINVDRQYFEMVSGALLSVERILSQRLREAGSFDAAGLTAELQKIVKDTEESKKAKDDAANTARAHQAAAAAASFLSADQATLIELDLKLLAPKLQGCVLRSKL